MREKYCKFSIFVFTVTTVLLLGFFMLTTTQAFADNGYKGKKQTERMAKTERTGQGISKTPKRNEARRSQTLRGAGSS